MKRKINKYWICFLISVLFISGCSKHEKLIATIGKDTVEYYGKGQYQIANVAENKPFLITCDANPNMLIVENDVFKKLEKDNKVYMIGENGFTVLDIEKNEVQHFQFNFNVRVRNVYNDLLELLKIKYEKLKSFNEFTEEEQRVFLNMLRN